MNLKVWNAMTEMERETYWNNLIAEYKRRNNIF